MARNHVPPVRPSVHPDQLEVPELPDFDLMLVPNMGEVGSSDSRHTDPQALIYWDTFSGGTLSWLQAAYDKFVLKEERDFEEIRRDHQDLIEIAREGSPAVAEKARQMAPSLGENIREALGGPAVQELTAKAEKAGVDAPKMRDRARPAGGKNAKRAKRPDRRNGRANSGTPTLPGASGPKSTAQGG